MNRRALEAREEGVRKGASIHADERPVSSRDSQVSQASWVALRERDKCRLFMVGVEWMRKVGESGKEDSRCRENEY
jgi:hypothetical protein